MITISELGSYALASSPIPCFLTFVAQIVTTRFKFWLI